MATTTVNYGFEKPNYDFEVFNRNADAIDAKIKEIDRKVDSASIMIDITTKLKYKFGVDNGIPYIEEVE
jgi:hypothetical protein